MNKKRRRKILVEVSDQILIAVDAAGICRSHAMTPDGERDEEGLDYRVRYGVWP
jgi:D-arabinose 1-dehydrogenase-like Zn-dependent alcohol dehydrogenase